MPTPHYVVFYNGTEAQPERLIAKLSDSYTVKEGTEPPCLEMTATILNVNLGYNMDLMERCRTLHEYAQFVAAVRRYRKTEDDLTAALRLAIDECIEHDILAEFLRKNRAEVVDMLLYEYNEEEFIASEKELSYEEGKAEGKTEGKAEGILEFLRELGEVPEGLEKTILGQKNLELLKCWLKLSARVSSIEEFESQMKEFGHL